MITLRDTVEIKASPEQIFDFFLRFKENYYAWHPDHVECRYLTEGPLVEGSIIYIEEYIHGKLHKFDLHITKIEPNSRIEYKTSFPPAKGGFIIEPRGASSVFTAEMHMGPKGRLLDGLMRKLLSRQLEGLEKHMIEEGQNLKNLLEGGRKKPKKEVD